MSAERDAASEWDVVVVGAGPVGLLLAGELAGAGIRTVVFEAADVPSAIPKANGVVGRSARDLAKRGILAGSKTRVVSPPRFQFGALPLRLGFGPRNPLHILPIPQRRLEQLLEDRARRHGVVLRRGHAVTDFAQDADGVEVEVRTTAGAHRVTTRYLVGCDGARSFVRKHAGIEFPGFTSDEISRIGRVTIPADRIARDGDGFEITGVGRVAGMRPNRLSGGGFSIAPVSVLDPKAPEDLYLVSTHEPRGSDEATDTVSIEELRASLHRVLGADLPITDATAIRSTVGNSRLVDAYRVGRVLLAGDAAHIFNAGGSALNVGLQDALDLAPRLVASLGDGASADALDGYEAARRPRAEQVLEHTRVQAALTRDDDAGRALRGVLGAVLANRAASRAVGRLLEDG
jgi:2-polyprenyl-6-methoxyphenol hydroxylase-like FAD-dependent oxidoreductase